MTTSFGRAGTFVSAVFGPCALAFGSPAVLIDRSRATRKAPLNRPRLPHRILLINMLTPFHASRGSLSCRLNLEALCGLFGLSKPVTSHDSPVTMLGLPDHAHRRKSPIDVRLGDRPHPPTPGSSNCREKRRHQASCPDRCPSPRRAFGPAHRPSNARD